MKYKVPEEDYIHGGVQLDFYGPEDVESASCPVCDSDDFTKIYQERGHLGIVKCNICKLIYTNPRAKFAEENYFGNAEIFYEEARLIFSGKKPHHRDHSYSFVVKNILKFKKSGALLDIGSHMGFFLRKARDAGFKVKGVEPSKSLMNIAVKEFDLDILNDYFSKDFFEKGHFDVVTMVDVFEHITEPIPMLKDIAHVLKDDGILCLKVPNGNYNVLKLKLARMVGKETDHELFNSYEHVTHYTPETMSTLLSKVGMEISKVVIPLPIHPPLWANLVGHYYLYPSPAILDWKRILLRVAFHKIGKLEHVFVKNPSFPPDLLFFIRKK